MSAIPAESGPASIEDLTTSARLGGWSRLRSDRWAVAGGAITLAFIIVAVFAPQISSLAGVDPYTYHIGALYSNGLPRGSLGGISGSHLLGVEPSTGRDLFAIVVYGTRTSLFIGFSASLLAGLIGTTIGLLAGFTGGAVDMGL